MGEATLYCNNLKCLRSSAGSSPKLISTAQAVLSWEASSNPRQSSRLAPTAFACELCLKLAQICYRLDGRTCANAKFNPNPALRTCPACHTKLPSDDEVTVANLSPSSDFKSTLLAGLQPSDIMDICSRALNFHHYQLSQEAVYQKLLYKRSQDRAQSYSKQYENLCHEAEAEVSILNEKLAQLDIELQQERVKVRDLQEARKESNRHAAKLKAQHGPAFLRPTTPDMEELASIEASVPSLRLPSTKPHLEPSAWRLADLPSLVRPTDKEPRPVDLPCQALRPARTPHASRRRSLHPGARLYPVRSLCSWRCLFTEWDEQTPSPRPSNKLLPSRPARPGLSLCSTPL
jgi:E3 ubiquitin-protein ligase CCNP1IP1